MQLQYTEWLEDGHTKEDLLRTVLHDAADLVANHIGKLDQDRVITIRLSPDVTGNQVDVQVTA